MMTEDCHEEEEFLLVQKMFVLVTSIRNQTLIGLHDPNK